MYIAGKHVKYYPYLISATLVTGDHVSVVFDGGFVHAATTEIVVVRHRTTFGTVKNEKTDTRSTLEIRFVRNRVFFEQCSKSPVM